MVQLVQPPPPGHDARCERGWGIVVEECHCHARSFLKDPPPVLGAETPWGLFAFERQAPDTRGHEKRPAWPDSLGKPGHSYMSSSDGSSS